MVSSSRTKSGSLSSDRCKSWPSVRETCSNVIWGFFFPKARCLRGQDVHPDSRTEPMTYQALVGSDFKRAEATFLLGSFEPLFHAPASEGHSQHFLKRRVCRSVRDEVLDLARLGIAGHDQPILPIRRTRSTAGVLRNQVYPGRLHVPDALAAGRVLDVEPTPILVVECRAEAANVVHSLGSVRPLKRMASRFLRPATKIRPDLADHPLPALIHAVDELWNRGEFLVAGNPGKADSIGDALLDLVGRDLPFGAKHEVLGDMGFLAPVGIVDPRFGHIEVRGNAGAEGVLGVVVGVNQMLPHHAVVNFPGLAAPLSLRTRRFVALLGVSRTVDHADRIFASVFVHNHVTKSRFDLLVVPGELRQEQLKRPHGHTDPQGDRLHAFSLKLRQQSQRVIQKVVEHHRLPEAIPKLLQPSPRIGLQRPDFIGRHRTPPCFVCRYRQSHMEVLS